MTSPLDRIPPRLPRAPYELLLADRTLVAGGEAVVDVVPVGDRRAPGPMEVALVCRSADDGGLVLEVAEPVDADGGSVTLRLPADAPPTAEGEEIAAAWTVVARATDGRRRTLALPVPVWVAPADDDLE